MTDITSNNQQIQLPDNDKIEKAIQKFSGNIRLTANYLGISSIQLRNWIYRKPERRQLLYDAREELLDYAEETLQNLLMNSDNEKLKFESAKFILQNLGYQRGYNSNVFRQQITLTNDDKQTDIRQIFGLPDITSENSDEQTV